MKPLLVHYRLHTQPIGVFSPEDQHSQVDAEHAALGVPRQYYMVGDLSYRDYPQSRVSVMVMIDTGCDHTMVAEEIVIELDRAVRSDAGVGIPVCRRLRVEGVIQPTMICFSVRRTQK